MHNMQNLKKKKKKKEKKGGEKLSIFFKKYNKS